MADRSNLIAGDIDRAGEPTMFSRLQAPLLVQYWQIVQRWKWVIAGIMAAFLLAGLIITLLITPKYYASSRVEVSREQKNVTNVEGVESGQVGREVEFYQTQYSLLEARSLAERVVRALNLTERDDFFAAHGEKRDAEGLFFKKKEVNEQERAAHQFDRTVKLLQAHLGISPIRGSSLIDVGYTSSSPQISAEIANAFTQEFIAQSNDRRLASTAYARRFLERRLDDLRVKVEKSERDLVNYASAKGIVSLGRTRDADSGSQIERTLAAQNLVALSEALSQATADRIAAQSRLGTGAAGASAEALTNQAITGLRQRRAEAAADYAKLLTQFEPNYPPARALQQQVKTLDASIAREEARVTSSRQAAYRDAVERENRLKDQVARLGGRFDQQQRDSIQYSIYQREADTNRQLYDALLQRYKEIGVAGIDASNIAVIDAAKIPHEPSSPHLALNLLLALVLGAIAATAATAALNQVDEGVRDPAQVNRLLQIPLLGSVPHTDQPALELLQESRSPISEAYFSIRSNLAFSSDHGVPRTLVVTSTRPSEGKTTTSIAVAAVLGRTGKKVLLIDGDMRSPSIHRVMGTVNLEGLSNILAGEDDWQRLVHETSMPGVSFISSGPQPPSAAELLSSDRMRQLLDRLLGHFEHVVVDSPPILGLADAPLLSRAVEGTLFVIEANGVPVRGIQSALTRLRAVHTPILAAILTKLRHNDAGYGYGYDYDYSYGGKQAGKTAGLG